MQQHVHSTCRSRRLIWESSADMLAAVTRPWEVEATRTSASMPSICVRMPSRSLASAWQHITHFKPVLNATCSSLCCPVGRAKQRSPPVVPQSKLEACCQWSSAAKKGILFMTQAAQDPDILAVLAVTGP